MENLLENITDIISLVTVVIELRTALFTRENMVFESNKKEGILQKNNKRSSHYMYYIFRLGFLLLYLDTRINVFKSLKCVSNVCQLLISLDFTCFYLNR